MLATGENAYDIDTRNLEQLFNGQDGNRASVRDDVLAYMYSRYEEYAQTSMLLVEILGSIGRHPERIIVALRNLIGRRSWSIYQRLM